MIPADGVSDGTVLTIKVRHSGESRFGVKGLTTNPDATCTEDGGVSDPSNTVTVRDGVAEIWTCGASDFGALLGSDICSPNTTNVTTGDCEALAALFAATDGVNWTNSGNWGTGTDVSTWHGVTIVGDRVTDLSLLLNNLNGPLPTAIGNLTGLTMLTLQGNSINGQLPSSLGNLTALTELNLR